MLHRRFATHEATVRRADRYPDGQGGWEQARVVVGMVVGSLQPGGGGTAGGAEEIVAEQERSRVRWRFFTDPGVDVQVADELVIGARTFDVVAVLEWAAASELDHWAITLEETQRPAPTPDGDDEGGS